MLTSMLCERSTPTGKEPCNGDQQREEGEGGLHDQDGKDGDKSFWTKIGVAFTNKDESLTVILDAMPVDGRLHIRDFKERDEG